MKTIINLDTVCDNCKSFYGKAKIEQDGDRITLISYDTEIVRVINGRLYPLWEGYSMTTARHIKEFFKQFYGVEVNKKTFEKIQNKEITTINELMQ